MNHTITLSAAEEKAMTYIAMDTQDWIENAVKNRASIAIEEIVQITVQKCLETNTQIPGSKDAMVELSFEQGWVIAIKDVPPPEPTPAAE